VALTLFAESTAMGREGARVEVGDEGRTDQFARLLEIAREIPAVVDDSVAEPLRITRVIGSSLSGGPQQ
jgi:hypothetical protein